MGCCSSRQADEVPPAATTAQQPNTTRVEATNRPAAPSQTSSSDARNFSVPRLALGSRAGSASNAASRPNKPLRPTSPVPVCPPERALHPWTHAQLARERDAFFDTRVTGDPQTWQALRLASEMLRKNDVKGAQGILDTMGLTCPTGRVKHERSRGDGGVSRGHKGGVYDERGQRYEIPGWVIRDPDDVVDDSGEAEEEKDGGLDGASDEDEGEDSESVRGQRRDEKGKGRAQEIGEVVKIRARLSDRGTDVIVQMGVDQRVRVLVRRIQEKAKLASRIRLVYLGKVLNEDKSLAEQGWKDGHVVNALVF